MEDSEDRLLKLLFLSRISFLTLKEKIILLNNLDSVHSLALLSINEIENLCNRKLKVSSYDGQERLRKSQREIKIIKAKKIKCLSYEEPDYPALLREINNPPLVLFCYGDISCLLSHTVSVVGTRHITQEGKIATHKFSYDAVNNGYTVVSGLAKGVDGFSHKGCIDAYYDALEQSRDLPLGRTCAVLPTGIDVIFPATHKELARSILRTGGCIISEYGPETPGEKWRFVQRNRIIASLSPCTVVIEAPYGSGALLTCQFALDYNREVMFHKVAFSATANEAFAPINEEMKSQFAKGKISKTKFENTPEKYIASGAPVVEDFSDFMNCLKEVPGTRSSKTGQLTLF